MKIRKQIFLVLISILICSSMLVGCVNAEVGTKIKINSNGSTETLIKIKYDELISKIFDGNLINLFTNDNNLVVNKYTEGSFTIEETVIKTEKIELKDILKSNKSKDGVNNSLLDEYLTVDYKREKGFLRDKYTVRLILKRDLFSEFNDIVNNNISKFGDNYLTKYIDSNVTESIGSIPFNIEVEIPLKIIESNGTEKISDKSVKWDFQLKDLKNDTELSISFSAINVIYLIITILVIIIIIVGTVIFTRQRKKNIS